MSGGETEAMGQGWKCGGGNRRVWDLEGVRTAAQEAEQTEGSYERDGKETTTDN